jgi:hypothetical protein
MALVLDHINGVANRTIRAANHTRRVPRPSYDQLVADLQQMSWLVVGVKYRVSDNAVRKWMRRYEAERRATR